MIVHRIGRTKFAHDVSGEGARLHGGRWNHKLVPCIYTSDSRALALLEYTANVNIEDIPRALSITTFDIPDEHILKIPHAKLPGDWALSPVPASTKDFISRLFEKPGHLVIRVPSAIVPEEFNYLLNPLHPHSSDFQIVEVKDFVYDVRLKLK